MQIIKRSQILLEEEKQSNLEMQWNCALDRTFILTDAVENIWREALTDAEENHQNTEAEYINTGIQKARELAIQYLDSKEGKLYLKKQIPIVTDEIKNEIQRGKTLKPKDIKKMASERASEKYIHTKEQSARQSSFEAFQTLHPHHSMDPEKLRQQLSQ